MSELNQEQVRKIPIMSILTGATCGAMCWEAREEICRCSCGGKNHGCLITPDGVQPERSSKINGHQYVLKSVGERLYSEAREINRASGPYRTETVTLTNYDDDGNKVLKTVPDYYKYYWSETQAGAPARLKPASKAQLDSWPELAAYRDCRRLTTVYLLWVKKEATNGN